MAPEKYIESFQEHSWVQNYPDIASSYVKDQHLPRQKNLS
jgi:hypothetical protein